MSYIKRDLLLADIIDSKIACARKDSQIALETFERMVKWQPTADVVEVVRCKDCKHLGFCGTHLFYLKDPNSFCSNGERKEG